MGGQQYLVPIQQRADLCEESPQLGLGIGGQRWRRLDLEGVALEQRAILEQLDFDRTWGHLHRAGVRGVEGYEEVCVARRDARALAR